MSDMLHEAKAVQRRERSDAAQNRQRLLTLARQLFAEQGVEATSMNEIAQVARLGPGTLYRHFASKDELVAEYLRCLAEKANASWEKLAAQHPRDPRAQLRAWLEEMADHLESGDERGCPLANAAVELPDKDHPARRVIEAFKNAQRNRITQLCAAAYLAQPELLADELFLLLEGARVTAQSMGRAGLGERLIRMGEAMIAAHQK